MKHVGGLVPCGRCMPCRFAKSKMWTFRLMMEARLWDKTWWTTLTFNDDFLPRIHVDEKTGQVFEHEHGTLNPYLFQTFIKRVRKELDSIKFRYFAIGEYGDVEQRPHYHICVFGHGSEINDVLQRHWSDPISKTRFGFVDNRDCGPITKYNAAYTCGYTLKKLRSFNDYRLEGRYPERPSFSKGIGLEFAQRYAASLDNPSGMAAIRALGDIPRRVRYDGKWWPLDRYMRDKILQRLFYSHPHPVTGIPVYKQEYHDLYLVAKEKFDKEMYRMSIRAELDPKNAHAFTISPFLLERQYRAETHQAVLNIEKRASLYRKGTTL